MRTSPFAGCCTAYIISEFGGATYGGHGAWANPIEAKKKMSKQDIISELKGHESAAKSEGMAFISTTTNNTQTEANAALEELGWESSEWMSKRNHPDTEVKLWWKHVKS